jgi:hypothetical protein
MDSFTQGKSLEPSAITMLMLALLAVAVTVYLSAFKSLNSFILEKRVVKVGSLLIGIA